MVTRCGWVPTDDELYIDYHDAEWGVPVHDDHVLFEFLLLEGAQAGLSWRTILGRRDGYRTAFCNFNPAAVAQLTDADLAALQSDERIIRNKLKIASARKNAQAFLDVAAEFGSFDTYLWSWTDGKIIANRPSTLSDVPAETELSRTLSADLKKRGFNFVGPTILYAYLQATGVVNDHTTDCFRA